MSKLYIVPTPIGNLGDMTGRAIETLKNCQIILAEDTRHTQKLLNFYDIKTKLVSYHKFNEKMRSEEIINELVAEEDKEVALVTDAGTPCTSDPGFEIVRSARQHGVEVIGLAGASALTVALSVSGIDNNEFVFYGFLPKKRNELDAALQRILNNPVRTFVIYESPKRIIKLMEIMQEYMPNALLCICKELTKIHETSFYGEIADVLEKLKNYSDVEKGEYVVVGYNNDYEEGKSVNNNVSVYGALFDKMMQKQYTLKEAVNEAAKEGISTKNEAYKASLEIKRFMENF